tara:strand:+ start:1455 stop:2012 length:558 start_codon:yes stop_codon:yes gene_type:complete
MSELRTNRIVPRDGLPSGSSGGIIQVVSVAKRDIFSTTNGVTGSGYDPVSGLAATITPTRSDSKILIMLQMSVGRSANHRVYMRLGRTIAGGSLDNTIFIGDANGSNTRNTGSMHLGTASGMVPISSNFLDSPGTTSAVTYQPAICGNQGDGNHTCYVNRQANSNGSSSADDVQTSSIVLMELSG